MLDAHNGHGRAERPDQLSRPAARPLPGVAALALQVTEVNLSCRVGAEDTVTIRAGAGLEPVQEQAGEQERGQVVDGEGVFQAIGGDPAGGLEPARVVDQHVQPRVGGQDLAGQPAHLGLG